MSTKRADIRIDFSEPLPSPIEGNEFDDYVELVVRVLKRKDDDNKKEFFKLRVLKSVFKSEVLVEKLTDDEAQTLIELKMFNNRATFFAPGKQ